VTLPADDASSCMACDLVSGAAPLPGGTIHRTDSWVVEHCVGPLGVGTLIVKPIRHITAVADLLPGEAAELGELLTQTATAVSELIEPQQVYVCLWSHANRRAGHIHFVVQPATQEQMERFDAHGPALQVAMFESNETPPIPEVEAFASRAASWFIAHSPARP
jgi:diadenosine tetraphosphate (Ap4A) HIT family hydrolase